MVYGIWSFEIEGLATEILIWSDEIIVRLTLEFLLVISLGNHNDFRHHLSNDLYSMTIVIVACLDYSLSLRVSSDLLY